MNSLDDLRATLDRHAEDITHDATSARVASVRARAVRARRQRNGAVAGAAAAVVAIVAAATLLPGGTTQLGPSDRTLLGRGAPASLEALGYTYSFERGVDSTDGASSLELEASDEPRLITWASTDSSVKLVDWAEDVDVSSRVDFDDWAYVPPGVDGTWTVHANGTALAVYTLTHDRPEGVTVDGITYRDQVAGDPLLGAEIGEVGQDEVSVTYTVPEGDTRWSILCAGGGKDVWIHLDLGDRIGELVSGPDCEDPTFDPGGFGGSSGPHGRTGETVTATVYLTDGQRGPRLDLDDVRLGLGVYAVAEPAAVVGGGDMPELAEFGGHLWRYAGAEENEPGATSLSYRVPVDGETELVKIYGSRTNGSTVEVLFGDRPDSGQMFLQGGGGTDDLLIPGERMQMSADSDDPGELRLGYARYVKAD